MAIGALMQRAAMLWLSNESTVLSELHLRTYKSGRITKEFADDLRMLRKKYVYAQNNIFLHHLKFQNLAHFLPVLANFLNRQIQAV